MSAAAGPPASGAEGGPAEGARFSQRLGPDVLARVRARVVERVVAAGLAGVVTDDPEDVAYLTGFWHHPCERPVAVWLGADGRCVLLLPVLEREHAAHQGATAELVDYPEFPGVVPPFSVLADVLGQDAAARAAVGAGRPVGHAPTTSWERLGALGDALRRALPAVDLAATDAVRVARYRKLPEEVALHAEAGRITDLMLAAGRRLVEEAVDAGGELPTEAEVAEHVTAVGSGTMRAEHDDVVESGFLAGGLVYSGPGSAHPHARPSGRRLRRGETFMLSLGACVGGRYVEGERTFVLGEPDERQRRLHDVVRRAQEAGAAALRPGARCCDVNAACLAVVHEAGLSEHLLHRQGHGIGVGMHEPPWLEDGDPTVVEEGFVLSDEPGLYVPGHAGYRTSDSMLVTADGARPLTTYPRALDDLVVGR
ncbi:Xaa-Pro peptidase family protein [Pseudokineococcus marinus]|uniref:Aminopeptidase P family protein n=1 Tax=Pseudokineococcus marinus TaxID=351215 RepID=A0A849BMT6_9ACTN|nr:Xaa-Pro peptidase family protein [Pseudokineococcus marinus]NNH21924.1 aminopeptidase P family protein [Pseudokineococcus marinus]